MQSRWPTPLYPSLRCSKSAFTHLRLPLKVFSGCVACPVSFISSGAETQPLPWAPQRKLGSPKERIGAPTTGLLNIFIYSYSFAGYLLCTPPSPKGKVHKRAQSFFLPELYPPEASGAAGRMAQAGSQRRGCSPSARGQAARWVVGGHAQPPHAPRGPKQRACGAGRARARRQGGWVALTRKLLSLGLVARLRPRRMLSFLSDTLDRVTLPGVGGRNSACSPFCLSSARTLLLLLATRGARGPVGTRQGPPPFSLPLWIPHLPAGQGSLSQFTKALPR